MDDWMPRLKAAFPNVPATGDVEGDQPTQQAWFEAIYLDMFPPSEASQYTEQSGNTGTTDDASKTNLFYYGMKARPNWKPRGAVEQWPVEEAKSLPVIQHKGVNKMITAGALLHMQSR
ncbi:hypothetical protein O3W44_22730 [Pantoea sp. LMR881]|uniref:hypothetical protein n=1 Tax=Pantoea sp. LMR881 TaxID=3014336 RepID=UPI0022AF9D27|nr:hypothetical protein [Pantoea sp. LMR881]MCZ4061350.1 hypothetical protein [Pantoea sp. LMR881]